MCEDDTEEMKPDIKWLFDRVISIVFSVILLFLMLSIIIGVVRLFVTLGDLAIHKELSADYLKIISAILTLFILAELSRSLAEYFTVRRLRLTYIVDAAIVFVLREVMIDLFEKTIVPPQILSLSVLLLALTVLRVSSMMMYQREKKIIT